MITLTLIEKSLMTDDKHCFDATLAVERLKQSRNNRFYPELHFAAPAGWINDPNGLIYYNQQYHLFYQHYPFSGYRGPMHWGHAISEDLINWQHLPIALAPGKDGDKDGVYSGSAIEYNGQMMLFYTGHTVVESHGDKVTIKQVQMLATSQDGHHFDKHGIILEPPEHIQHFRDPKVWQEGNIWKMVVGVSEHNIGQVWLYTSTDLIHWQFDQVLLKAKANQGWMWECPDFFPLGDKWVLVVSPMGIAPKGFAYNNTFQVGYFVGKMINNQFVVESDFTELDNGLDLYAPQTYFGTNDKRIMLSWFSMPESKIPEQVDNWSTCLTFPRLLSLNNAQRLIQQPIPEIKKLRQSVTNINQLSLNDDILCLPQNSTACELIVDLDLTDSSAERLGIMLAYDPITNKSVKIYVDKQSRRLFLDRSGTGFGPSGVRSIAIDKYESLSLHIISDKSSCEIFVNGGESTLSARLYANYPSQHIALFAENGNSKFVDIQCWQLKSIWIKAFPNM